MDGPQRCPPFRAFPSSIAPDPSLNPVPPHRWSAGQVLSISQKIPQHFRSSSTSRVCAIEESVADPACEITDRPARCSPGLLSVRGEADVLIVLLSMKVQNRFQVRPVHGLKRFHKWKSLDPNSGLPTVRFSGFRKKYSQRIGVCSPPEPP
jgi:hypothetical protein